MIARDTERRKFWEKKCSHVLVIFRTGNARFSNYCDVYEAAGGHFFNDMLKKQMNIASLNSSITFFITICLWGQIFIA